MKKRKFTCSKYNLLDCVLRKSQSFVGLNIFSFDRFLPEKGLNVVNHPPFARTYIVEFSGTHRLSSPKRTLVYVYRQSRERQIVVALRRLPEVAGDGAHRRVLLLSADRSLDVIGFCRLHTAAPRTPGIPTVPLSPQSTLY